jgi:pimeloyl-ACP methyl ester carboxylesterase
MADALAAAGWTTVLPEYARVAGDPAPTITDLGLIASQAAASVDHHDGTVILIGHSAGGHLVLWASAAKLCPVLAGTLALGPAADLLLAHELGLGNGAVTAFLGAEPVSRPDLDPRQLPAPTTPLTIVHGVEDDIVPLAISESFAAAHPRTRLVSLEHTGHFGLIDPLAPAWSTVVAELHALSDGAVKD